MLPVEDGRLYVWVSCVLQRFASDTQSACPTFQAGLDPRSQGDSRTSADSYIILDWLSFDILRSRIKAGESLRFLTVFVLRGIVHSNVLNKRDDLPKTAIPLARSQPMPEPERTLDKPSIIDSALNCYILGSRRRMAGLSRLRNLNVPSIPCDHRYNSNYPPGIVL